MSALSTMDVAEMAQEAKTSQTPHICLVGADGVDGDILVEWNRLCRLAKHARTTHRAEVPQTIPPTARMLVVNRDGKLMIVHDDWMRYFSRSGTLLSVYAMSLFDQRRILTRIEDLPIAGRVLIYDPESVRCLHRMQQWTCDDKNFVMHMSHSAFPAACVVYRKDEMLHVSNI